MDNVRNQTASTEESLAGVEEVAASADSMLFNVNETLEVSKLSRGGSREREGNRHINKAPSSAAVYKGRLP